MESQVTESTSSQVTESKPVAQVSDRATVQTRKEAVLQQIAREGSSPSETTQQETTPVAAQEPPVIAPVEIKPDKISDIFAKFQRTEKRYREEKESLKRERDSLLAQQRELLVYKTKLETIEKDPVAYFDSSPNREKHYEDWTGKIIGKPPELTAELVEQRIRVAVDQERQARQVIEAELNHNKQQSALAGYRAQVVNAANAEGLQEVREFCNEMGCSLQDEAYQLAELHAKQHGELLTPADSVARLVNLVQRNIETAKLIASRKSAPSNTTTTEAKSEPAQNTKTLNSGLSPQHGTQRPMSLNERKLAVLEKYKSL